MKKLLDVKGIERLSKEAQSRINGGLSGVEYCDTAADCQLQYIIEVDYVACIAGRCIYAY